MKKSRKSKSAKSKSANVVCKKGPEAQKKVKESNISLPSRLKRQRGTASSTPLPPEWSGSSSSAPRYLTPKDGESFESCVKECYRGFIHEKPNDLPSKIHDSFTSSFEDMNDAGLFLYDVVQPGRKKLSLTFVTRTLVGDPGSTYKYLGLRLFSHPWCDVNQDGDRKIKVDKNEHSGESLTGVGYSKKCARSLIQMGSINAQLQKRTDGILKSKIAPFVKDDLVGSAKYSLTLINKMEPTSVKKDLKNDNIHGIGKTSVSWHKDSGLQDFSSIAVYHTMKDIGGLSVNDKDDKKIPWEVALRVASTDTRTPAVSVPLPSGSIYYLLDDFNHQHEHAVISGSESLRYSSTHRVARDGAGTWQYIRDKCESILSSETCLSILQSACNKNALSKYSNTSKKKQLCKEVRACQRLITELEFEWIRQWFIQGRKHASLHPYWINPMKRLEESYRQLNLVTSYINLQLEECSKMKSDIVIEDLFDVTIESIENRFNLRRDWNQRLKDSIFKTLPDDVKPFVSTTFEQSSDPLPSEIRKWKSEFIGKQEEVESIENKKSGKKRKRKDKHGSLTKKEKKRVASNWERMKNKK